MPVKGDSQTAGSLFSCAKTLPILICRLLLAVTIFGKVGSPFKGSPQKPVVLEGGHQPRTNPSNDTTPQGLFGSDLTSFYMERCNN